MSHAKPEDCARCFIGRIGAPSRKSKRVHLLGPKWTGALDDPIWVAGALATTALRQRPHSIAQPQNRLGYKAAEMIAKNSASKFLATLRCEITADYTELMLAACRNLTDDILPLRLHWPFGRSQKFFNILAKYWYCVAQAFPERLKNADRDLVAKCATQFHAPVDSITLNHIRQHKDGPALDGIYWGWNMNEGKYLEIQRWLEKKASEVYLAPIGYELIHIW